MAPSVVLAQATWYGSFRAGIDANKGVTTLNSFGSRWGVKGSNEISDGLSAVYRYEESLDLRSATLGAGNRLSYVGLSGGFGTLTMGRVWGAEYNSTGAILDASYFFGSSEGSYRVGPAVSYAISTGPVSLQLDAIMSDKRTEDKFTVSNGVRTKDDDNGKNLSINNNKTVDRMIVGASAGFGAGKVAISYDSNSDGVEKDMDGKGKLNNMKPKTTNTTIAGEVSFGSMRAYVGQATSKEDGSSKVRAIMGGVGGSIGDTGMGFLMQATQKRDATGKPTPILLSLYRSLGGGSTVILEGVFNDKNSDGTKAKSRTALVLKVDF